MDTRSEAPSFFAVIHRQLRWLLGMVLIARTWCQECPLQTARVAYNGTKRTLKVGVLAIRGVPSTFNDFNVTFGTYLNEAVGNQFDPPLRFEMIAVQPGSALETFTNIDSGVDFVFANPTISSCIDTELGTHSLATFISRRTVKEEVFELEEFGGVIFTRSDNQNISTIQDVRWSTAAMVSITGLGSGQMQFRVLHQNGVHHFQDIRQLIFTKSQEVVVDGVLDGRFDVGFVRTDQLERSIDVATGELLDLAKIKVIEPIQGLKVSDGSNFPFPTSTALYPEWNLVGLPHVNSEVAAKVQRGLLDVKKHAAQTDFRCIESSSDNSSCIDSCNGFYDTSHQLALAAQQALKQGRYAGWRPSLSYMTFRSLQEEIGYLTSDQAGFRCVRSSQISQAIVCPPGHFKRTDDEIANGCEREGLSCYGYSCVCSPCVKAFEVGFGPVSGATITQACAKFDLCGTLEQTKSSLFQAIDNERRDNATMYVSIVDGSVSTAVPMRKLSANTYQVELHGGNRNTGVVVIEVFLDGQQIPESPFRIEITPRRCAAETGDPGRMASPIGECVCGHLMVPFVRKCEPLSSLLLSIIMPSILLLTLILLRYNRLQRAQIQALWKIEADDIDWGAEPVILQRGAFGEVLLAHYRGTKVAVKRCIYKENPPLLDSNRLHSARSSEFFSTLSRASRNGPLLEEIHRLSALRHPHITTIIGAVEGGRVGESLLVMEFMESGSLFDVLSNGTVLLDSELVLAILQDVACGLQFLHTAIPQITHKDLKSKNILMDASLRAKLCDFHLSHKHSAGTPLWTAPEVLRGDSRHSPASDIYSFGIVLYEVLSRRLPYAGKCKEEVIDAMVDPARNFRPELPPTLLPIVCDLYRECVAGNPRTRPSIEQVSKKLSFFALAKTPLSHIRCRSKRTEDLLHSVFPQHIADALRNGESVEPEKHDLVTVVFIDIVGFTQFSSNSEPTKVSNLLDRFYGRLDKLSAEYDLFTVESIGDCYIACSNLHKVQNDHVLRIAEFALDSINAASETMVDLDDPTLGMVKIRAGLHSGPVVSHVIGSRTPRYSLLGDTVNTGSRMESNSEEGRLLCTDTSAGLLEDPMKTLELELRPPIHVKGKGQMHTYWIRRAARDQCLDFQTADVVEAGQGNVA